MSPHCCSVTPSCRCASARRGDERDGFAKLLCRCCEFTLLTKHESEVVPRFRVIRLEADRRFERRARAVDVARPPPRRAEMILGVEKPG